MYREGGGGSTGLGIIPKKTNNFFSASLNYVWGIVRRKSLHYVIEDHLVRFAACHEWYTIHNLCWTRACHDHQPRRWSGMVWEYFITHWLQGFAIFSLALLFIIGPLSQNWKVWQPLCCWLEKTLCMFDYQDKKFCESRIYFFIAKFDRILVQVGYFILNICCCSMSVALRLELWPISDRGLHCFHQ